jgi:DNA polymerase-1
VPQDIVAEYAIKDVLLTKKLWIDAWTKISEYDNSIPKSRKRLSNVVDIEAKLLPVVYGMEKTGVHIDRGYCLEAIKFYREEIRKIEWEFKEQTGEVFQKSPILFKEIFKDEKWRFTEKNNPSFTAKVLATFEHPVAQLVTKYDALKKNLDYFQTFDYYADKNDTIRPNMMSAGTKTGRFSCSDPNLQNLTRPDKYEGNIEAEAYPVRGAFRPREGCFLWAADYDQMELKMMADRSGAYSIARKIKAGLDFHNATAELASVQRHQAKTVNFAVAYGSGLELLAKNLKTTVDEAKRIKGKIFEAIPEIPRFMRELSRTAEDRGYIFSWSGRVLRFPDKNKSYKALNHYVQGGCADVVKLAMIECADFIKRNNLKTRLVLQVHDELVFEVPFSEEPYLRNFIRIMESIYPHDILPLTASAKIARKTLAEKVDWVH